MGSHSSEGSSSTLSDPDSGSEASTVKNVRLKSRVELPDRMKESDGNKRAGKENTTREGNEGKLAKIKHVNLPIENEKKNNRRLRNNQVCQYNQNLNVLNFYDTVYLQKNNPIFS